MSGARKVQTRALAAANQRSKWQQPAAVQTAGASFYTLLAFAPDSINRTQIVRL